VYRLREDLDVSKKYNDLYLIKLSPDKIINESSTTYSKYYTIPQARRFVLPYESTKADTNWTHLGPQALSGVTANDKLLIVAHASPTAVANMTYTALVNEMYAWGLREVGLIVFKCCNVGRGTFLESFAQHAFTRWDMKIGWLKGYRGPSGTWGGYLGLAPQETVMDRSATKVLNMTLAIKTGSKRYKEVPGFNTFPKLADDDD
jgi:hypothetical protein